VSGAVVLLYHRVGQEALDTYDLQVSVADFRRHLQHLSDAYHPVALTAIVESLESGTVLPDRAVAITFDDGYLQHLTVIRPMLDEFGIPATFFVTTEGLNEPHEHWWDVLERVMLGVHQLPPVLDLCGDGTWVASTATDAERVSAHASLTQHFYGLSAVERRRALAFICHWSALALPPRASHRALLAAELEALAGASGVSVGAHTIHHIALPARPVEEGWSEVTGSKSALESLVGRPMEGFSYPYGAHSATAVETVRRAGYRYAVTVEHGTVDNGSDVLRLPRCEVKARFASGFAAWLAATAAVPPDDSRDGV
jgi:peptidoglycan/xylan/chitin deacetylase (PgdA/CDA1 family)